jgi:hypothetical protein
MRLKLLLSVTLLFLINSTNSQVNSLNLLYNSVPGIGCHSRTLACVNYGSQPESGAEIKIDWADGYRDSMIVYGSPNTQGCYEFSHDYTLPGNYVAVTTVYSGTLGGQVAATQSFNCVVTSTSECGFFNVISLLNPSATFLNNVPEKKERYG